MRKIIVWTRITMDGVLQAPSGPEEDLSNGFKWGGWIRHYWDEPTISRIEFKSLSKFTGRQLSNNLFPHLP